MADVKERDRVPPQVVDNSMAGQNLGAAGDHPEKWARTAKDVKQLHARFSDWLDSDLDEVPILPEGSRLEQGATYIDLRDEQPAEFMATGGMEAGPDNLYVAKSDVHYEIWNRLLGITNPQRTGIGPSAARDQ
ncbi:MAG TPA: hypothetical protein VEC39_20840 [Vicinamibacterales bacterium]|nr:hypothetical protein [Vicinamibacterales bacterium]